MSGNQFEILSPAGSPEALRAAVFAGADAVYLGGVNFGARKSARNFTEQELSDAVSFCHARGVKVHVTVNTLLKDAELMDAIAFIKYLCKLPVDAVLVQDMGLFSIIRRAAPELPVHASTQMSLMDPAGVGFLAEKGAKRVVLSRELTLKEISQISRAVPQIELECFIHGALCMSVSGQCYLSAALGGRSGNRGMCAQPCRLPFSAPGGTGHDLSLKDLSAITEIPALRAAGICSGKIEGRMKRPEYVAAATLSARLEADGEEVPGNLTNTLKSVFSRSGFTDGYLKAERGRDMFGIRTEEDERESGRVLASLRDIYRGERPRVPVVFSLAERDGKLLLTVSDTEGREACAEAPVGDAWLTAERAKIQLLKTGGTPFYAVESKIQDGGVRTNVAGVNALRRQALSDLLKMRERRDPVPFGMPELLPREKRRRRERLYILGIFRREGQIPENALRLDAIALPLGTPLKKLEDLRERGFENIMIELPRAAFGAGGGVPSRVEELARHGFCDFIAGNLGHIPLQKIPGVRLHGSFGLNICNTESLRFFEAEGLKSAEVSLELSEREASNLGGTLPLGTAIYGRQALMLTRNCPLANSKRGCLRCESPGFLTDRKGKRFPVLCTGAGEGRYSEAFNSVPLILWDSPHPWADYGILRFTIESLEDCGRIIDEAMACRPARGEYTRGLSLRGVE